MPSARNLVYVDSDCCRWHFQQIQETQFFLTNNLDDLVNSTADTKLAVFHIPFPFNNDLNDRVDLAIKHCDRIAILGSELHQNTVAFINQYQHPKIKFFLCGVVNNVNSSLWLDWFITGSNFYKYNLWALDQLHPHGIKPKTFDILLGRIKPHRSFVYDYINKHGLNDRVVMTYMLNTALSITKQDKDGWIWGTDNLILPNDDFNWTVTQVNHYGSPMTLSQVIPYEIYNQTAYSVVTETNFENNFSFYTEKTLKPLLAKRLFVVFAGQHHLRNLRSFGFKTFDGIIDESYDSIEDHEIRWTEAIKQVEFLFHQPQEKILEQIKPIVEHNQKSIIEVDWFKNYLKEFEKYLVGG